MSNNTQQDLLSAAQALLQEQDDLGLAREVDHRFIETLTFSQADSIVSMLDEMLRTSFIEFPVWARNLAFRLAILQRPDDAELLRRAAADLRCFGPDWDAQADRMIQKAESIANQGR